MSIAGDGGRQRSGQCIGWQRRLAADVVERGGQVRRRHSAGETGNRPDQIAARRCARPRQRQWPPHVGWIEREEEAFRQDADDRMGTAAEDERPADDVLAGVEPGAPELRADHRDRLPQVVLGEPTPANRRDAEQREESGGDIRRADSLGGPQSREREIGAIHGLDGRQRSGSLAPRVEGGEAHRARLRCQFAERRLAERYQRLGIRKRRRGEQHGVDDGQDGGGGAESERQRQDGGTGTGR
jgi:hypothetical protein